ncbi:hypothetical protein SMD11_6802 [Streptomyces albireticuli]|uniref:Htaa domain-containing protein n=1 Tax=Streptomyces albireticuli TaxID=1940 RepID=A0A1Z2LDU1_9ACTN|nr:hypothetical protein [Streptomyces albireticuli]ARZ72378.1 hypothetical protein SMD11_6802 [Streptomyces albireticuli]
MLGDKLNPGELVRFGEGRGEYHLTSPAATALQEAGIVLKALSPGEAHSNGNGGVSLPITGGDIDPDLSRGKLHCEGGFDFTHSDGRRLEIRDHWADAATSRYCATVAGREVPWLAFRLDPQALSLTSGRLTAKLPVTLTDEGAALFTEVLGASPVSPGEHLFDTEGQVSLATMPLGL